MARGSSQYRLSTCQLGLNPIYFLVDEIFLALHHPPLATICCGLGVKDPLYMEIAKHLTKRFLMLRASDRKTGDKSKSVRPSGF